MGSTNMTFISTLIPRQARRQKRRSSRVESSWGRKRPASTASVRAPLASMAQPAKTQRQGQGQEALAALWHQVLDRQRRKRARQALTARPSTTQRNSLAGQTL